MVGVLPMMVIQALKEVRPMVGLRKLLNHLGPYLLLPILTSTPDQPSNPFPHILSSLQKNIVSVKDSKDPDCFSTAIMNLDILSILLDKCQFWS